MFGFQLVLDSSDNFRAHDTNYFDAKSQKNEVEAQQKSPLRKEYFFCCYFVAAIDPY